MAEGGSKKMKLAQMHKMNGSNSRLNDSFFGVKRDTTPRRAAAADNQRPLSLEDDDDHLHHHHLSPLHHSGALPHFSPPSSPSSSSSSTSPSPSSSSSSTIDQRGSGQRDASFISFEQENVRLRLLLHDHLERMKDASAASKTKHHQRRDHHHQRRRKHQQLQLVGASSRQAARRRPRHDDDDDRDDGDGGGRRDNAALVAELNKIRDAKIAEALLRSAESGTTGVTPAAEQKTTRTKTRTERAKSEASAASALKTRAKAETTEGQMKRRRGVSESGVRGRMVTTKGTIGVDDDDNDEEERDDDGTGEESDDTTSTRDLSPGHDERQCKMGWEKRWRAGERQLDDDDDDEEDDRSRSSSASSWEDSDSDSDSSSESSDGSEEDQSTTTTDNESREKRTRDKGHTYNFYKNSLFREQQRLSSGLITPRKGPMDRRAWTAEMVLHHRNSMLVSATAEWDGVQSFEYVPLYWHLQDGRDQHRQGQVARSPRWKLQQASDYELFNEFRCFKTIVQTPRGGYKAEAIPFGHPELTQASSTLPSRRLKSSHHSPQSPRRPLLPIPSSDLGHLGQSGAKGESAEELTPRRKEGDWVAGALPAREKESEPASAPSTDAERLLPIVGEGLVGAAVCAAAAEAGSGERKPVVAAQQPDSPYPGVSLYDSFAFKSLLQKEGQRKERAHQDSSDGTGSLSLFADDWKRGLKLAIKEDREVILGGEVARLMSHLADCNVQDRQFVDDFLCSFRSFAQPEELLDFLIDRYSLPPPSITKDIELASSLSSCSTTSPSAVAAHSYVLYDKYLPLLQLRVLNVLRKWLANHFYDFEDDPRLLARLLHFVENTLRMHQPNEQHYEAIKCLILEQAHEVLVDKNSPLYEIVVVMEREDMGVATQIFHKGKKYVRSFNGMDFVDWCRDKLGMESTAEVIALGSRMIQQNIIRSLEKRDRRGIFKVAGDLFYRFSHGSQLAHNPPVPRMPNRLPKADRLAMMDIDAIELARQFTLYSECLYRQITPTRLVGYMQAHRKMAITSSFLGIFNFLNRWDEVAKWTTREVLSYTALPQRVAALRKLINVAKACFGYNNFFDMSAILCGLNHSSINRLKKTWKSINKKERKVFDELSGLISPDNSYKLLREMQREAWKENFNKAERYTVRLSDDAGAGGDTKRRPSSSSSSSGEEIYGLIPYIAIYIIDLEHLSQVPETMANGMVNFAKKKIEASIFSEMIKFREHKYNFVPIEPYRQWVDDIPQRSFGIFHHSRERGCGGGGKGGNETRSSSREDVRSDDEAREDKQQKPKVKQQQQQVVAYDDKLLWEISLRLEPRIEQQ